MKKLLILLVLAGAAGGGGYYYWRRQQGVAGAETPQVPTAPVERGSIRLAVASTGRVVANLEVDIKCKASGEIIKLPFDISEAVKKGELLVELDPVDEERRVKLAEADLAASVAKHEQAKQSLLVAEHDLVTATEDATVALKSAQAKADQAKQNLAVAEQTLVTTAQRAEAALESAKVKAQDAADKAVRMKTLLEKKLTSKEESDTAVTADAAARMELANAQAAVKDLDTAKLALGVKRQDVILAEAQVESARIAIRKLDAAKLALEVKRQDVALAAAQVDSSRIDLSLAQRSRDDTKVVAPMDGVVSARDVQIGQIISSGISNVGGGTTLLTLADLSRIFVLATVDESDVGGVKAGQTVQVTADAFAGRRFPGKVVRIAPKGVNASNVVTFEVKIEVLGPNKSLLKPEMTANVEILIEQKDNVLLVPTEAVTRRQRERIAMVVEPDGGAKERVVEVGVQDGTRVEITKGLSEGETVQVRKSEADSAWRKNAAKGPTNPLVPGPRRR
ncbi:MAG TPA: efflux RND transporter periplasmic adaptor subunit [Planctomycetota bacterium]|nr:efflux RND transporter periplasmic adaptor subunit [Planctomycetota bacterium]